VRFEGGAIFWHGFNKGRTVTGARGYNLRMEVPHYEPRDVRIAFEDWQRIPKVTCDGPPSSPHRYADGSLCMWYPHDPPERKWVFEDGLLMLLNVIQRHLFWEAWWRETDEWLGDEAPHGPLPKEPEREDGMRDGAA